MAPGHDRPEVLPDHRHRNHRDDGPPPHVLRDAGQLLARRLLQGEGHPARLGAGHHGLRARPGAHLGHGVRDRRRVDRDLGQRGRRAPGADPAPRRGGQLLGHGSDRAVRAVLRAVLRPGPGVRRGGRPGRRRRGALRRVLEPRLHAVQPGGGRHAHRPPPAATSTPAPGWSGSWPCCKGSSRSSRPTCCGGSWPWPRPPPAAATAPTRRPTCRCGSWPTTAGP